MSTNCSEHLDADELFDYLRGELISPTSEHVEEILRRNPNLQVEVGRLRDALDAYRDRPLRELSRQQEYLTISVSSSEVVVVPIRWWSRPPVFAAATLVALTLALSIFSVNRMAQQKETSVAKSSNSSTFAKAVVVDAGSASRPIAEDTSIQAKHDEPLRVEIGHTVVPPRSSIIKRSSILHADVCGRQSIVWRRLSVAEHGGVNGSAWLCSSSRAFAKVVAILLGPCAPISAISNLENGHRSWLRRYEPSTGFVIQGWVPDASPPL